ncbi:MAG: NUDIX domain-containing protein [Burkholderiales bacterium]|nr:NUDIX domain-containing protein [Burkholderiales bacterium]
MGFDDTYRMSSHAVITNGRGEILMLKATYGNLGWGFPGGALDPGETIHEALLRECMEELLCEVGIRYLSGIYHHSGVNSHALIFRCELPENAEIRLSEEHSEWRYRTLDEMNPTQRKRVEDCLSFDGTVKSAVF